MKQCELFALAGLVLLATAIACPADEVDDLVKRLKPPARFKDHKPDFSVEKGEFAFEQMAGPEKMNFWIIKDADRYVAIIPMSGFHGGTIYVLDFNPETAPKELKMPAERWHIDTAIGSELRTDAFVPVKEGATDATYEFKKGDGTLTLVRRYKGTVKINKWQHRAKSPQTIDTTNTFVLRLDPIFGYVVEGTWDTRVKPAPGNFEYASAATSGRYSLWPGTETCYRTVITPTYKEGYEGYYLNLPAIDACDDDASVFQCRDGGFTAFLNDVTGWSPATTIEGSTARLVVCNAHADLDFVTPWPKDTKTSPDAASHRVVKHRILALPPEVTRYVWENMSVRFEGRRKVQIRVGTTEKFEDQPLPYTTRVRGISFTGTGPEITERFARSGRRSLLVKDTVWPNLPQLALKPRVRYRLEAWIKVVPEAGKEADAEAYITGHLYEWSPHNKQRAVLQQTNSAKAGGDEWQRVSLEFTAPKWGPFIDPVFVAKNCTAYVDDFCIAEVKR